MSPVGTDPPSTRVRLSLAADLPIMLSVDAPSIGTLPRNAFYLRFSQCYRSLSVMAQYMRFGGGQEVIHSRRFR
jgi:hypothetical protein